MIHTTLVKVERYGYNFTRQHNVNISIDTVDNPPIKNAIAFFNVYVVNRLKGGNEEGGWWYDHVSLEYTLPFLYNESALELLIAHQMDRILELAYGTIESVNGGQDAFVLIESEPGASAHTDPLTYS